MIVDLMTNQPPNHNANTDTARAQELDLDQQPPAGSSLDKQAGLNDDIVVDPDIKKRLVGTRLRVFSSIFLIPAAISVVYFGGVAFFVTITLAALAMVHEWARMVDEKPLGRSFLGLAGTSVTSVMLAGIGQFSLAFVACAIGGIVTFLMGHSKRNTRFWAGFGVLYIIAPSIALVWLREVPEFGRTLTFMLFAVVWGTDIGAFFAGRLVGGPKFYPTISPKKTWAGTVGGVLLGASVFTAIAWYMFAQQALIWFFIAGAGLAMSSVAGDIVESAMKRGFGVKDSGGLIPGHGGVLDRLDGMIFATVAMVITLVVYRFMASLGG